MDLTFPYLAQWGIPALFLACAGGLAYSLLRAIRAGTESYSSVYTEQTARQFADIFFFFPPRRILEIAWISALALFALGFLTAGGFRSPAHLLRGLVLGCGAGGLALAAPRRLLVALRRRRLERFNTQLVDALSTISNALRSGSSLMQSFEHIVRQNMNPISQEFGLFLQQTRVGVKFEDALNNLEQRVNSEDLALVTRAIEIARQSGGNLTEVFDKIAMTIRERVRIQGRIRALTAQGRLQGLVVGLMPVALGLIMLTMDPALMLNFFSHPFGLAVLAAVVLLDLAGILLIRKIVNVDI